MGKRKSRYQEKEINGLKEKKKHKRNHDDALHEEPDKNEVNQDGAKEKKKKKKKQKRDKDVNELSTENGINTAKEVEQEGNCDTAGHGGYHEHAELTSLAQREIDEYLTTNTIAISPPCSLRPLISFKYLPELHGIHSKWAQTYSSPTPIQAAAWPLLLDGKDVIGVAETGSGKTLAFAVPCIQHIVRMKREHQSQGVMALIVSPTRELALQITDEMTKVANSSSVKIVCLYGGVGKGEQQKALMSANVIVATPGRLNDLASEGTADLSNVGYLVLDEADRMLDKGFEQDIRDIIQRTPPTPRRQTMMFTATWPPSVQQLAATFMTSPIKITIGNNAEGHLRANTSILQKVEVVDPRGKEQRMLELLKQHQTGKKSNDRILLFCLYKKEATRVEQFIRSRGFRVAGIHGDMSQSQRIASLEAFRSGSTPLLVATDVAARGLDIPEVKVVINLTFPLTVDDYVHRIGRTGRAGKQGLAITLFTDHDKAQSGALINVLKGANQEVPEALLKFGTTVKKKDHEAYGAFYKDTNGAKAATKIKFDD